eukprot:TRINITY_DN16248_c0_g1_i1.p1 TRINITY_DN16248_c0_g1~~TRINITY_DN16248_c0_g1_i1.p1  ORF type:complete len:103 (-),score=17.42 TRINITY_DN16248_c0_g1_i1:152-460(-)
MASLDYLRFSHQANRTLSLTLCQSHLKWSSRLASFWDDIPPLNLQHLGGRSQSHLEGSNYNSDNNLADISNNQPQRHQSGPKKQMDNEEIQTSQIEISFTAS